LVRSPAKNEAKKLIQLKNQLKQGNYTYSVKNTAIKKLWNYISLVDTQPMYSSPDLVGFFENRFMSYLTDMTNSLASQIINMSDDGLGWDFHKILLNVLNSHAKLSEPTLISLTPGSTPEGYFSDPPKAKWSWLYIMPKGADKNLKFSMGVSYSTDDVVDNVTVSTLTYNAGEGKYTI